VSIENQSIEDQLRDALAEHSAAIGPPPDRWHDIETRAAAIGAAGARHKSRRRVGTMAAMALAAGAAALIALPALRHQPSRRVVTTPGASSSTVPTPGPTTSPPSPVVVAPPATPQAAAFGYQPLYPFQDQAAADAWRTSHRQTGVQPWHLDPAQTALTFSRGYLGYTDISTAFSSRIEGKEAFVTVGFPNPNGQPVNSAVVHLVRFGSAGDAPWEVVGTEDSDFSLTTPRYGATVSSTVTVGGRITGVDENIKVEVLQQGSTTPLVVSPGTPGGGTRTPWSTTVAFRGATARVLTIAASTGGHLATVERFTVTGVQVAGN
jgi:hypothetical protein